MEPNFHANFNFRPSVLQQQMEERQPPLTTQLAQLPHVMPTPTGMPWANENMPWAQHNSLAASTSVGNVMQFQARTNFLDENARRALLHSKRKSELPLILHPTKQFISEEKIAASFNGLHISSNYGAANDAIPVSTMEDENGMNCIMTENSSKTYPMTPKELEEKLRNANRITLCEDVKKLHEEQRKATLLPEALLNRIEKPCTAIVLWQPPPILELLHRKKEEDLQKTVQKDSNSSGAAMADDLIEDIEFLDSEDIDDFDNNNTCSVDYNNMNSDAMDNDDEL